MTGDELFWVFWWSFVAFWVGVVFGIWLASVGNEK